jgi:putative CocE/NonD family hydrolase
MLLRNRHPAVKAVVPRFSLFDVYPDVAFPGGLHLAWFTAAWGKFNGLLDRNRYADAVGLMARINLAAVAGKLGEEREGIARAARALDALWVEQAVATGMALLSDGVRPCDGEVDPIGCLTHAVACHVDNADVHAMAQQITHRDDAGLSAEEPEATIDSFSPHAFIDAIAESGAAVLGVSGWLDGAYQHAAIKRHLALPSERSWLQIGPWDHGGRQNVSPFDPAYQTDFDHDGEILAFFDAHLRGHGEDAPPRVRWFTMGEERWESASSWPPPGIDPRTWFFDRGERLVADAPIDGGADAYAVDPELGSGPSSRWRSLLGLAAPVGYGGRAVLAARMRVWDSAPLDAPMTVTGHPLVHLWISADASDASVFVYLEDVAPDGRVTYVTEGELRAIHRRFTRVAETGAPVRTFARGDAAPMPSGEPSELAIDLLPVSYRFAAGHRVRVALAAADVDHFRPIPDAPRRIDVLRGGTHASRIVLPVRG